MKLKDGEVARTSRTTTENETFGHQSNNNNAADENKNTRTVVVRHKGNNHNNHNKIKKRNSITSSTNLITGKSRQKQSFRTFSSNRCREIDRDNLFLVKNLAAISFRVKNTGTCSSTEFQGSGGGILTTLTNTLLLVQLLLPCRPHT